MNWSRVCREPLLLPPAFGNVYHGGPGMGTIAVSGHVWACMLISRVES